MNRNLTEYMERKSGVKKKNLKYDFMPLLIELIEKPADKWGSVLIFGIILMFVILVIWSAFAPLDIVVAANGVVKPEGDLKTIQTYVNGVVSEINVENGDFVKEGDVIARLSLEENDVDISAVREKIKEQEACKKTAEALYNDTKRAETDEAYQYQIEEILEKERLYQMQILLADSANQELLMLQRNVELLETINQCTEKIQELQKQLDLALISKEYSEIRATATGFVNELGIHTIGQLVTADETIAVIVPDKESYLFTAYVETKDVADIQKDMEVSLKLDAYPYSDYGMTKGVVKRISPSSVYMENVGQVYLVDIDINNENSKVNIISGLSGTAELHVGKRTVLKYLTEPIMEGFQNSMKEK